MSAHPCATVMQASPQILIRAAAKFGMTKFRATLPRQSLAIYWAPRGRCFCKRGGRRCGGAVATSLCFEPGSLFTHSSEGRARPAGLPPLHRIIRARLGCGGGGVIHSSFRLIHCLRASERASEGAGPLLAACMHCASASLFSPRASQQPVSPAAAPPTRIVWRT